MVAWLWAFLLTEAVEVPVYAFAFAATPLPRRLLVAALPSALTHPVLWVLFPFIPLPYWPAVATAEAAVVAAEALCLRLSGARRALAWAFAANAASVAAGLVLRALGVPV